ncbi:MAG: hypothetical protein Barrevirus11_20 [Barrevirus sp.]|uniref:Uncharacterized protein n=1 Tax=Barrevirus sp. TaxID=2487763 RepID=A0A3G4ZQB7_9VIRU|nr:MAG: hypothetical protein Barrevirus11_20 [Barrevirus sp.]
MTDLVPEFAALLCKAIKIDRNLYNVLERFWYAQKSNSNNEYHKIIVFCSKTMGPREKNTLNTLIKKEKNRTAEAVLKVITYCVDHYVVPVPV